MAKKTFLATDPSGVVHKHVSKDRAYVAAVVYQHDKSAAYSNARGEANFKAHAKTGHWYLDCVENGKHLSLMQFKHYADDTERQAQDVADSLKQLAGAATPQEYAAARVAEDVEALDKIDWNKWLCAGWCGRADLAQKLASMVGGEILPATMK